MLEGGILLNKNILAVGIIFLIILSALAPMSVGYNVKISDIKEEPSLFSIRGKTLYVGGTGDGNYTKIQDVIDNEVNRYLNEKPVEYVSLFYGDVWMHIEKESLFTLGGGRGSGASGARLYFDADLDELRIELVLNYTAEMNYTLKFPFVCAPIFALGIKIQNITKYEWVYFKLKHHGYFTRCGNFSIVFNIDMTSIESGDELKIQPIISLIILPLNFGGSTNKSWRRIIRLIYHIPFLNELLLSNWLFPKFATYETNHHTGAPLFLFFD